MIAVISTSDSENSRGAQCAQEIRAQLDTVSAEGTELIDWGRYPAAAGPRVGELRDRISGVVLVAPVRNFGIAAPTKSAFEQLPDLFRGRPVGIVMTAGTARSLVAVQSLVVPLILDFGAVVYPGVVHLSQEPDDAARLARFTRGFARFHDAVSLFSRDDQPVEALP